MDSARIRRTQGAGPAVTSHGIIAAMTRICENVLVRLLLAVLLFSRLAHGAVVRIPLKSNVALKPSEAYILAMDVAGPVEISWEAVQAKPCNTDCVQVTYLPTKLVFAARSGSGKYTPVDGKISVEYKNISSEPVTIDIYRVQRTCDAEACQFLASGQKGRLLVYKVDEFKTIATSKDESYSVITGTTTLGRPFSVRVVWWTDDKMARFHCAQFIQRYLANHTQKDQYRPYILSGMAIGEGNGIVLKSIDTCVPKAPNFGVADANVFR